ncbi:exodeoxyribonuclease V subunit beta [Oceanobacter mangrovi]|uniref:exodeoxyribonuclease V subunit beta n=1 Tax=Oceanobacter mangrovi TaxID=2862510 RepID=UPI001C8EF02B|nr:exodeoxyribonuclease V subunit beta [Oceanobacter mangrovi]
MSQTANNPVQALPLDVSRFPLTGQSLIEASAGTGKTFTIASLYSRLAIGHNNPLGQLACDQILVVTFTKAATEELRGRIRDRLRQNHEDVLRQRAGMPLQDPQFAGWLDQLQLDEQGLEQLTDWLQVNLSSMDDASIYTIHGFCQRMLKQFAFDSGVMFSAELEMDSLGYLQQACEDIWRRHLYQANIAEARFFHSVFSTPEQLQERIRGWFARPDALFLPAVPQQMPDSSSAEQLFEQARQSAEQQGWQQLQDLLVDAASNKDLNNVSYKPASIPARLQAARRWFQQGFSLQLPDKLETLTQSALTAKTSKKGTTPTAAFFGLLDDLLAAMQPLLEYRQQLRCSLPKAWFDQVQQRYFELMEQAGAMSPDDLLRLLDSALQGPQGALLAGRIRALYPVALIDEFQDTDPLQYRIFSTIYRPSEVPEQVCGLAAIGDPKQAIYAFRGADIFTYIQARRSMAEGRIFTLDTNWRSHSRLISAVNGLFAAHPAPFVFAEDIPFQPVKAAGRHDHQQLTIQTTDGWQTVAPLQFWFDEQEESCDAGQRRCARECAETIRQMLSGATRLGEQAARAGDMAVLVRTNKQAEIMRHALALEGITAVMLSRESVFNSDSARELLIWLAAIADPSDERQLRNALATRLYGYSSQQLDQLQTDEQALERVLQEVRGYHQLWASHGIMAALMQWLATDQRAVLLRQGGDGERLLTDLLHLGELLQQASRRLRGQQALLRWFTEHVLDASASSEEAQLRLESDANLVSIVTIHKSKGLEYPLVFLPFLWNDVAELSRYDDVRYLNAEKQVVINLDPDDDARQQASRDKGAEFMRLLYVALTRPVQGCFVWLSAALAGRGKNAAPVLFQTAIGELLQAASKQLDGLAEWNSEVCYLGSRPLWPTAAVTAEADLDDTVAAAHFERRLQDRWRVSSFTGLSYHDSSTDATELQLESDAAVLRLDETGPAAMAVDWQEPQASPQQLAFETSMAVLFPRGAQPGTCLHSVFEQWDFHSREQLLELLPAELDHFGVELPVLLPQSQDVMAPLTAEVSDNDSGLQLLADWFERIVATPLAAAGEAKPLSLANIDPALRLDEMEFCLPVTDLRPERLNALLIESDCQPELQGRRKKLQFNPLSGFLKGFIDLLFCFEGKYYLLDYKSNYLGDQISDYQGAALHQAMLDHHYDLQAWIYTLALDQLLALRLPDYDPEQHLGGVIYLFLRGLQAEVPVGEKTAGVYFQSIDCKALQRWKARLLRGAAAGQGAGQTAADEPAQGELPL